MRKSSRDRRLSFVMHLESVSDVKIKDPTKQIPETGVYFVDEKGPSGEVIL